MRVLVRLEALGEALRKSRGLRSPVVVAVHGTRYRVTSWEVSHRHPLHASLHLSRYEGNGGAVEVPWARVVAVDDREG